MRSNAAGAPAAVRPRVPGALPGDPGMAHVVDAIETHHSAAVAAGLPAASIIWFIADRDGIVLRTGIERGPEREVEARMRARYPTEISGHVLAWADVEAGTGEVRVLWLLSSP